MTTTNLKQLELNEFAGKNRPQQHCKASFPMLGAHGTQSSATVYFEIEPGDNLGMHTDSAEEMLLILEGEGKVIVGDEQSKAGEHSIALVPEMIPHDIVNTGNKKMKVLGFFGGKNHIVATFQHAWMPVDTHVIDTKLLFDQQPA